MKTQSGTVTLALAALSCFVPMTLPLAEAQQSTSQPASSQAASRPDNIGHRRHHHVHNPAHAKAPDASRFTTNRNGPVLPLPTEQDAFTFVVFGDRTGGPATGVSVLADAVHDTNLLEPDLVMTVGDLIQGYNDESVWVAQMREYKDIMDKLLCPWFPVAGNHDVYWRGPKGADKPAGENEPLYEMHFGPLWYGFEHKNCWFIALYSDEGNLETGEKAHNKPDSQKMSPAQYDWLAETLKKAKGAEHVFLFLHHPRWLKGGYGDDWDRVHDLLKSAGNVTAVFAGHIHRMRYDGPRDGIEYVTLATVGGGQDGVVPAAGYLHQFHIVTVRKNQVAMASVPVGEMMDVREITGTLMEECTQLSRTMPIFSAPLEVLAGAAVEGTSSIHVKNPSSRPIDVTVATDSQDSRWRFGPDHDHGVIEPGATREFRFNVSRRSGPVDDTWRPAKFILDVEYLAPAGRYPLLTREFEIPLTFDKVRPPPSSEERVLAVNGTDQCLQVPSDRIKLPDGPLTLECWFNAVEYGERTGLLTKTEGSDYGIFVNRGVPAFSVHVAGSYLDVKGKRGVLDTARWQHIAGVYDGKEARLYVDGRLIASAAREGKRKSNDHPLTIGADVTKTGGAMSFFRGSVDGVRLSKKARYSGEQVSVDRRPESDADTLLLLNMDGAFGPWILDESDAGANAMLIGEPQIQTAGK